MSAESPAFLPDAKIEAAKEPIAYERAEMQADLSAFSGEERDLVLRFIEDESMEPKEAEKFRAARERWFEEKYGFPYRNKAARREVLTRKYAPPEEIQKAHDLEERMFAALSGEAKPQEVQKIKEEYLAAYPDQLEGIEAVFAIRPFLELSHRLDTERIPDWEERSKMYQDITENHFLLTHFLTQNNKDKKFLNTFWLALEKIAAGAGLSRELNIIRRGVVTQVATLRVFEELGMRPQLSHPKDDAFRSIDMWSDSSHAVQVKSAHEGDGELIETDEIAFPGIQFKEKKGIRHINSKLYGEASRFKGKIKEYRELVHNPDLKGYFIVIPHSKVDFVTGEPDKQLIEDIKRKIGPVFEKKAA